MPVGTHLGPYYLWWAPKDISPTTANVVAGSALAVLIMTTRGTPATTIRELWKDKVYYLWVLKSTWHAKEHTVSLWGEGEGERGHGHGVLTWLELRWDVQGLAGSLLKHMCGN